MSIFLVSPFLYTVALKWDILFQKIEKTNETAILIDLNGKPLFKYKEINILFLRTYLSEYIFIYIFGRVVFEILNSQIGLQM